jgi:hypothetical protein
MREAVRPDRIEPERVDRVERAERVVGTRLEPVREVPAPVREVAAPVRPVAVVGWPAGRVAAATGAIPHVLQ